MSVSTARSAIDHSRGLRTMLPTWLQSIPQSFLCRLYIFFHSFWHPIFFQHQITWGVSRNSVVLPLLQCFCQFLINICLAGDSTGGRGTSSSSSFLPSSFNFNSVPKSCHHRGWGAGQTSLFLFFSFFPLKKLGRCYVVIEKVFNFFLPPGLQSCHVPSNF